MVEPRLFINWEQELPSIWYPPSAFMFDMLFLCNTFIYLFIYALCGHTNAMAFIWTSENNLQVSCPAMWIPGIGFRQ